jgi:hypothetical protein
MAVRISRFEWDEYNTGHLAQAHPEFDLEFLEDVVTQAKSYLNYGHDRFGRRTMALNMGVSSFSSTSNAEQLHAFFLYGRFKYDRKNKDENQA